MEREQLQTIGANIRYARRQQGHSQASFAKHVGMDRSYIGAIERGERNFAILNAVQIAKALDIMVGQLFKGVDACQVNDVQ